MQDDDHYYVESYSAELDPYAQKNGVLKNNFGITDSASLNEVEADIAGVQIQKILKEPAPNCFTALHLCALHEQVFSEVYPWAGHYRQVDIAKGDTHFLRHQDIAAKLDTLFFRPCQGRFFARCQPSSVRRVHGGIFGAIEFCPSFSRGKWASSKASCDANRNKCRLVIRLVTHWK